MTLPRKETALKREDLIRYETRLQEGVRGLLPFTSHSLHFPAEVPETLRCADAGLCWTAHYEPAQDSLHLPLVHNDTLLGVFSARGVRLEHPTTELGLITRGCCLCMDALAMYKRSQSDALTGLSNREALHKAAEQEIELILACIRPGPSAPLDCPLPGYRASFGLALFRLDRLEHVNSRYGYALGDEVVARAATVIESLCPEHAMPARIGGDTLALLWPQTNPRLCRRLGERILQEFGREVFSDPVSEDEFSSTLCAGFANYPQDMPGWQLRSSPSEQCRALLHKARLALAASLQNGREKVFSFRDILAKGGQVTEVHPMHRLRVTLGRDTGILEGQRFLVWPGTTPDPDHRTPARESYPQAPKGEIQIMEVGEQGSSAEILHLTDPSWHVLPGDTITPVTERERSLERKGIATDSGIQRDLPTGLLVYRDFIRSWSKARQDLGEFALVMVRATTHPAGRRLDGPNQEMLMQQISERCMGCFGTGALGGRYSSNCLIFHVTDKGLPSLADDCAALIAADARELEIGLHIGIAPYPFLRYSRAETLDNCRKALEHAAHLPETGLAIFDSVSLNINADRLFSSGDHYAAMEEYKAALVADGGNAVARNSLGICYARLGLLPQAKREFQEVLQYDPQDVMALYNLGCVCLRLDEQDLARDSFEECVRRNPDHAFSLLRIGQMQEQAGLLDQAWETYEQVQGLKRDKGLSYSHLARVAWLR
ncbi:MAG: diguanylate cyclase domain-containing protein, partial [Desulfohalobiaceae bacterium]